MIITCPQCSTNYNVSSTVMAGGKKTRCSNCGHIWFQLPVPEQSSKSALPPKTAPTPNQVMQAPSMPPNQPVPFGYPPMPGQYFVQPGYYPQAQPIPPNQHDIPPPGASQPPSPVMPANTQPVAPEPKNPEEADSNPPEPEQPSENTELTDKSVEDAPPADLTEEQLDEMFGDDGDPGVIPSMMGGGGKSDGISDPDQIEDPAPIPQVMAGGPAKGGDEPKRSKLGLIIGIVFVAILLSIFGAVVLLKSMIIRAIPATETIYELVGLGPPVLGDGLDLKVGKSSFETENGKEILIVSGIIKNISDGKRSIPMLKVSLFDQKDTEVQSLNIAPRKSELDPGRRLRFKAKIESPSTLARRAEVTFTAIKSQKNVNDGVKAKPKKD